MANTTIEYYISDQTSPFPMTQQPIWLISEIFNSILTCISLWLILSVGIYGFRSGKFKSKTTSDCNRGLVLKIAFVATLLLLPRILATQAVILIGFSYGSAKADFDCEVAEDVSIAVYYSSLFPVYLFLWLRQRSLYQQPSIRRLYNKAVQIFSWGCLIFLIVAGIGIIIIFVMPLAYKSSVHGCVLRNEEEDNVIGFYVLTVVLVSGQLVLLSLFVYPLHRHQNVAMAAAQSNHSDSQLPSPSKDSNCNGLENPGTSTSKEVINDPDSSQAYQKSKTSVPLRQSLSTLRRKISVDGLNKLRTTFRSHSSKRKCNVKTAKRLLKVMRRSVVCAVVCIASDITAMLIVGFFLPKETPKSLTNTIFDVSLLINVVSLIVSYENYKKILSSPLQSWKKASKVQFASSISRTENETSKS